MNLGKKGSIRGVFSLNLIPWVPRSTKTDFSADHPVTLMCAKYRFVQVLDHAVQLHEHGSGLSNATQPVSKANMFKYCVALNCVYFQIKLHHS